MKAHSFTSKTITLPKYQNPQFRSIGKCHEACQHRKLGICRHYCTNENIINNIYTSSASQDSKKRKADASGMILAILYDNAE
jgi:hypothetical protein